MTTDAPIFPDADYYDCDDGAEELSHDTPEEAVTYFLDGFATTGPGRPQTEAQTVADVRREVEVFCFRRKKVSDAEIENWADDLTSRLGEWFSEEHGGPNEETELADGAATVMRAAVKSIIERTHVWSCESFATVTLTPDQAEAMMRRENPEWFEATP